MHPGLAFSCLALIGSGVHAEHAVPLLGVGDSRELMLAGAGGRQHQRRGDPLSTNFTGKAQLWPWGEVNFVIDTNPATPAHYTLAADDARILGAIANWEEATCIRFTQCGAEAECPTPYIVFRTDKNACNSPFGLSETGVNVITLASACSTGYVIHEIGHSLGLAHQHTRRDRDEYVRVNESRIAPGLEVHFEKDGAAGRAIGPYDYGSIMHFSPTSLAAGVLPVIDSPEPIGQRTELSAGDIAAVAYLYNSCGEYTAPTCVASKSESEVLLIPYGSEFSVEIDADWAPSESMVVSYPATNATAASFTVAAGEVVGDSAKTIIAFTPSPEDAGRTFTLGATFTAAGDGNLSAACFVTARVAAADVVCHGKLGSDPTACSGRGRCTGDNPATPCVCAGAYGGGDCAHYADCPANYSFGFDAAGDPPVLWEGTGTAAVDAGFKSAGAGSMRIGGVMAARVHHPGVFERISFDVAATAGGGAALMVFDAASAGCLQLAFPGSFRAGGPGRLAPTGVDFAADRFYAVEILVDAAAAAFSLRIDGEEVATELPLGGRCHAGAGGGGGVGWLVAFAAPGGGSVWVDNLRLSCGSRVHVSGSMLSTNPAELRAGGVALTLTVDDDEWMPSEQTKRDLIAGTSSHYPTAAGWDHLKATVVDASLVRISGNEMVLGPLPPAPAFALEGSDRVAVTLRASMVKSRDDSIARKVLGFDIEGQCALECPARPPVVAVEPTCFTASGEAPVFKFYAGGSALSPNDAVAVVPLGAADCADACAALGACSLTSGVVARTHFGVEWRGGNVSGLADYTEYRVCHRPAGASAWEFLEQSFTTCTAFTTLGCRSDETRESTNGAVRCCNDGGWCDSNMGPDMYLNCFPANTSFLAATAFCSARSWRLCTFKELAGGQCCNTGCYYNNWYVWFDNCATRPCAHGKCTPTARSFVCTCDDGYGGSLCDKANHTHCFDYL